MAQEENTLGRLLKDYGKQENSRAGKMMTSVGKTLSYTAQQRVALRNPLVRLFQEVDTFQSRAVEDTGKTVEEMEKIRTEYRGALMWMKNISKEFNPDNYQQLEKFREVQGIVKQKKGKFDVLKVKSLQKIDLLAASRCNMFSHALILYQNNLISFSEKTAKTLNSVASNFKGYHPYRFQVIKELAEPKELLDQEDEIEESKSHIESKDDATFFNAEYHDDLGKNDSTKEPSNVQGASLSENQLIDLPIGKSDKELESVSKTISNIDLLTSQADIASSSEELLKEIFDSPEHKTDQSLPVFEAGSNAVAFDFLSDDMKASSQMYMPSHLLDFGFDDNSSSSNTQKPTKPNSDKNSKVPSDENKPKTLPKKESSNKNIDWFKAFQDIDPLSESSDNPFFGKFSDGKKC